MRGVFPLSFPLASALAVGGGRRVVVHVLLPRCPRGVSFEVLALKLDQIFENSKMGLIAYGRVDTYGYDTADQYCCTTIIVLQLYY